MSDYNDGLLPTPCLRMDTHFGDEYESIEFGDGTGYIKAAPILAKVGALHEEIDRLRDESAKLREERDMYKEVVGCMVHPDFADQLRVENAKLRELVKECHELLQDLLAGWALQPLTVKVMEQRMSELGIEVDG